jgi:pimeloyl-ACP methyl ester carboxylesterase
MRLSACVAALAMLVLAGTGSASAAGGIAIVLLHGGGSSGSQFDDMVPVIERAGYRVVTPDMCWSQSRRYDESAQSCIGDVDKVVDRLKGEGYQRIVVGGHSQGGIFAIYYAANRPGLAGVIAFAPSGPPIGMDSNNPSVAFAHRAIAAGRGDVPVDFGNGINPIIATPVDYLSWTGMESPLYDIELLPRLTSPLLWVAGTEDPGQANAPDRYKYAPPNALNQFVTVDADHFATPDAAVGQMIDWLNRLSAHPTGG